MKIENDSIYLTPEELKIAIDDIDRICTDLDAAVKGRNIRTYLFTIVEILSTQKVDTDRLMNGPIIASSDKSRTPTRNEIVKTAIDIWLLKNSRKR